MPRARIEETHPQLLSEVANSEDREVVGKYAPTSKHLVSWECQKGHNWEATVGSRTAGAGCPVCSNRLIIAGINDLATTHPHLVQEWHPTKNTFSPETVPAGSGKQAWWLCLNNHEWSTTILSRATGAGCATCYNNTRGGRKSGQTLSEIAPEVGRQFISIPSPTTKHQAALTAETVLPNSKATALWTEPNCGHSWQQTVEKRYASYRRGVLCGVCDGRFVAAGVNDLFTKHPHLLDEWDSNRNGGEPDLSLSEFSNTTVHWVCKFGHSFPARVSRRAQGKGCSICAGRVILVGGNDLATVNPVLAAQWHPTKNGTLLPTQVTANNGNKAWWRCSKGHEWKAVIASRNSGRGCHLCSSRVSKRETELADFVASLDVGEVSRSDRTVLAGNRELDIYVPAKKVGVEFNGVYWHSEAAGRGRQYHVEKLRLARNAGIQLIQVWEDEWVRNPEQVKRMVAHKLGVTSERKVYARDTMVKVVTKVEARVFLEENHIQGFASGSQYVALQEKSSGEVVALLVVKAEQNGADEVGFNIIRYATSATVPGGFTKLLSYVERTFQPAYLVTFSDNCVSDGSLYAATGFVADKELAPDYMYVVEAERKHKFGYRLKRFKNDPELEWQDGLTEKQLADLNGLPRIWDAGKVRWVKRL